MPRDIPRKALKKGLALIYKQEFTYAKADHSI